ncbi:hypothetical protein E2C01_065173 [Portunus trituberculatus]|uniref:Uncharacterized protein n=1 Tax=Portunus trituberculatus TaxID=210409 RepID=A0A5B7HDT4_PORTR|nr:hypothetical protein [Portunus trituberculatus]
MQRWNYYQEHRPWISLGGRTESLSLRPDHEQLPRAHPRNSYSPATLRGGASKVSLPALQYLHVAYKNRVSFRPNNTVSPECLARPEDYQEPVIVDSPPQSSHVGGHLTSLTQSNWTIGT